MGRTGWLDRMRCSGGVLLDRERRNTRNFLMYRLEMWARIISDGRENENESVSFHNRFMILRKSVYTVKTLPDMSTSRSDEQEAGAKDSTGYKIPRHVCCPALLRND
jgi:hypothetical protein